MGSRSSFRGEHACASGGSRTCRRSFGGKPARASGRGWSNRRRWRCRRRPRRRSATPSEADSAPAASSSASSAERRSTGAMPCRTGQDRCCAGSESKSQLAQSGALYLLDRDRCAAGTSSQIAWAGRRTVRPRLSSSRTCGRPGWTRPRCRYPRLEEGNGFHDGNTVSRPRCRGIRTELLGESQG